MLDTFSLFFLNTNLKNSVGTEEFYKVYSRTSGYMYTFSTASSVDNQLSTQIHILQQAHETVVPKYCALKLNCFIKKPQVSKISGLN